MQKEKKLALFSEVLLYSYQVRLLPLSHSSPSSSSRIHFEVRVFSISFSLSFLRVFFGSDLSTHRLRFHFKILLVLRLHSSVLLVLWCLVISKLEFSSSMSSLKRRIGREFQFRIRILGTGEWIWIWSDLTVLRCCKLCIDVLESLICSFS